MSSFIRNVALKETFVTAMYVYIRRSAITLVKTSSNRNPEFISAESRTQNNAKRGTPSVDAGQPSGNFAVRAATPRSVTPSFSTFFGQKKVVISELPAGETWNEIEARADAELGRAGGRAPFSG